MPLMLPGAAQRFTTRVCSGTPAQSFANSPMQPHPALKVSLVLALLPSSHGFHRVFRRSRTVHQRRRSSRRRCRCPWRYCYRRRQCSLGGSTGNTGAISFQEAPTHSQFALYASPPLRGATYRRTANRPRWCHRSRPRNRSTDQRTGSSRRIHRCR